MAEDWRVTVELNDEGLGGWLTERLGAHEVEEDVRKRLGSIVTVTTEGARVLMYADTEAAAEESARVAKALLARRDLDATFAVDRWHPVEERWEEAGLPLPSTPASVALERERREADEAAESTALGLAEWNVRIELPSHRDAVELGERLEAEGYVLARRWTYLSVGAANEDDANALAQRISSEAPQATVGVEPGAGMVSQVSPFAVLIR
jgi:extradiol dioxygenase family protein